MSSFNFSAPTSTGASTGSSLFGTANSGGSTTGNLFGGGSGTGTGSSGFSFGAPAGTSGEAAKPLFGATDGKTSTPSIFGQPAGGTGSSGFSFGKKPEKTAADGGKPLFSGFGTPDKTSTTPSTSGPSLFGATTPGPASTSNLFSFGNASTTPAGPPPSTSAFGASTGGGSIFGSKQPTASSAPPTLSSTTPATAGGSLFSKTQSTSVPGGLFGPKPAATGGSIFGAPTPAESSAGAMPGAAQKPVFSFGAPAASATSPSASSAPRSSPFLPAASTSASTPSAFGARPATTIQPISQATPTLFGATQPTSQATPPLFGAPATTPGAGSTGSLFAPKPAATTPSDGTTKSVFSFPGATIPAASTATPATTTAAQKPLFGATSSATSTPSLFAKPVSPTAASTSASIAATTAPSTLFGGAKTTATSQPPTAPAQTIPPSTSAAPFGTSTLSASTSGPIPPAQSRLRNKTLDEILTRWATDLTKYTKEFKTHAETVARWDQLIVENSSKIDKLYVKTRTCEKQTMSVEMQLAAVENQQNELESWLTKYEHDVDEMLVKEGANPSELGGPDQERERTYKLAEKLSERLDDMGRDLESMVEEVNAANASLSKHGKADEPITQIVRILNSHLTQLQAIDQGTATLQAKVTAAQKAASHIGYLNGSAGGDGRTAVEDFYRSYMGRR